jgi:L-amino acid N-acyltransferase YncA
MPYLTRSARRADAEAIARIYAQGIEDRLATFETRARIPDEVRSWFEEGFPLVVVEDDGGGVVGWASAPPYRAAREAYAGVGSSPSTRPARAAAEARAAPAMEALVREAEAADSGSS